MNVAPQSSLITFITWDDEKEGVCRLVFACQKPLNDINPPKSLFWKEPHNLWEENKIKQWLVYGSDGQIDDLWKEITEQKKVKIRGREYTFVFPVDGQEIQKENRIVIKCDTEDLPQFLLEAKNLLLIEGYKGDEEHKINPIKPPGLFDENFLFANLSEGYRCCKMNRRFHYHFRGVRVSKTDNEPTEMVGFVQDDLNKHNYEVEFILADGTSLGKSIVKKSNGTFKVTLSVPSSKAQFVLRDDAAVLIDDDYTLLKETKIDIQVAENTYKDHFGRESMITSRGKKVEKPKAYTWHKEVFATEKESQTDLSDYMKNLLNYLGPDILICDPYFFGNVPPIKPEERVSFDIYLNAIFSAAVEKRINRIRFLGYWGRATSIVKDEEKTGDKKGGYFEAVKENFKKLILNSQFEKYLPLSSVTITNSSSEFHNRYWFGLKEHEGKTIIDREKMFSVTNSVNGVYKNGEIDFMPCTDALQIQRIAAKYAKLIKYSTETYTIG